jgi:hypothetical protein
MKRSPITKMKTGQPRSSLFAPSCSGGTSPGDVTNPASTKPMIVMNKPMPTAIACFSGIGTASKTAWRNFVSTRTRMTRPSTTITPIASGQLRPFVATRVKATNPLRPSPAASANGTLAKAPIATVVTPAAIAVTVRTAPAPKVRPSTSAPERIRGLRKRM